MKIQENPLECAIGEAYIHRDGMELGEWNVLEDVTGATVFYRISRGAAGPEGRYFRKSETIVDGSNQAVMVREHGPDSERDFDPRRTNTQCGGCWKYPPGYEGIVREGPEQCNYGDLLPVEEWKDRMFFEEFHQDLHLARLYDWFEYVGKMPPPELEEFVFDLDDRIVDGVPSNFFVRVDLEWVEAEQAERDKWA